MTRIPRADPVALAGSALIGLSWLLPFAVLRENRLAQGTRLASWEALPPGQVALLAAVSLAALLLALLVLPPTARRLATGAAGFLLLVGLLLFSASAASRLTAGRPVARYSFGAGALLAAFGGYVLIRRAGERPYAQEGAASPRETARRGVLLAAGAVLLLAVLSAADTSHFALARELTARRDRFLAELLRHLLLAGAAVGAAVLLGVPAGILAFRRRGLERPLFLVINAIQTVPSLALFGLLIVPLSALSRRFPLLREAGVSGIGWAPALLALTLYALLPVARNTWIGLKGVPPAIREAGAGMGMTSLQRLTRVELPLALPVLLGGARVSLVQAIGNTTVAALIGAGGLGVFIFQGLGQAAPDLILLGALPVIVLAVLADRLMRFLVRRLTREGSA